MFEKSWPAVPPQLFTANGNTVGLITVANTRGFKVKAKVVLSATAIPDLRVECKRVISKTQLFVGPINANINARTDVSAYTVAASAFIYQEEQPRATIPPADLAQAVYEQEPGCAIRTIFTDEFGNFYDEDNPLPIAFDGTISVGKVQVEGENGNTIEPNPDGSTNVVIVGGGTSKNTYNEVSAVPAGIETTIVQYTVSLALTSAILQRVSVCGENVGRYRVFVNGEVIDTRRTYYGGSFNEYFEFSIGSSDGAPLLPGDTVTVKVLHDRPYIADFQGRIQALEKI